VGDPGLTNAGVPPEVEAAAGRRSEARASRDWATADRLRGEIEAAGWRVVDSGTKYRLEPASPPSVEVAGEIRYGRSEDVPNLLDSPEIGVATVVVVASPDPGETRRCLDALEAHSPAGVDVVLVLDRVGVELAGSGSMPHEIVRTSDRLGHGAALNIGIRRSRARVVIVLDPSVEATGDLITPLVDALDDPGVAVAGPYGLVSADLRRFAPVSATKGPVDAFAIEGVAMAFRRRDAAARGPIDEGFRSPRHLDVWWSLVLRDAGEGQPPRRALVVAGLGLERRQPAASRASGHAAQERQAKRNFYRVLDRFRTRSDLAVPRAAK
jgi:Glycosyl transferase family 2